MKINFYFSIVLIGVLLSYIYMLMPTYSSQIEPILDEAVVIKERGWAEVIAKEFKDANVEVTLYNKTRVDILTPRLAIEVDWAEKFCEGYGQAKYYGKVTNRRPLLILLKDDEEDIKYVDRAVALCDDIRLLVYNVTNKTWERIGDPPR